ncbi:glucan biosynthesis protein D [Kaustia mangrovi]|uniref:Glucan biosynthesis protein D n=1 Tax=Kaustia mangrovi TaxID=2593653 RepID=A0A7S8HAZ6_9HYPH|nr:glucan biosynthesis protein D [Kaustia mangrovi]QPC41954.1 glucan biosynthesis protein D [Kaustia mangrovi]
MAISVRRRRFLQTALAAAALAPAAGSWRRALAQPAGLDLADGEAFSFEGLIERARAMAEAPYDPPQPPRPDILGKIDYDAHGKLHYRREFAAFADGSGVYPATFFHLGQYFQKPVHIFLVENGEAREVVYESAYFDMPADSIARQLPDNSGFAGFRLHESINRDDWKTQDWVAFLGASYFRAIGSLGQYGLSARGVAVDTAVTSGEEFPDFREFYIEPAQSEDAPVTVCALLDGPSIAGAFRFEIRRGEGVTMDVDSRLFLRADIERLGVAPLTSMFWYSEQNRPYRTDWRPEIHDSDGLALWTGGGERLWRPLNNPDITRVSAFSDDNPRGFGLMQRDREPTHYLDGVLYHRRPSLWVEPLDRWGAGEVQLVEIPTDDEIHDNIVAFWVPKEPARAGQALNYRYRLYWQGDNPFPVDALARTVATRIGRGGEAGKPRPEGVNKFVVEFEGSALDGFTRDTPPEVEITASRGTVSLIQAEPVPDTPLWRAVFDLKAEGADPVEIRLYLRKGGEPLTETWLYQHLPTLNAS